MRRYFGLLTAIILILAVSAGCFPRTPSATIPAATTSVRAQPSATLPPYPYPDPGIQPTVGPQDPYPQPQITIAQPSATLVPDPVVQSSPTLEPYPGPGEQATDVPYPDPGAYPEPNPYPYPDPPQSGSPTPTVSSDVGLIASPTAVRPTPTPVNTAVAAVQTAAANNPSPTPYIPNPLTGQVVMTGKVTVWHTLNEPQLAVLQELVRSFIRMNPEVRFEFQYIPIEALRQRYYTAAYLGGGPSLLIAPAEWGAAYYADNLVEDLSPYIVSQFRETILPAPLAACQASGAQYALPLAQTGLVMYRNTVLVPSASANLSALKLQVQRATRSGNVGLFIDLGAEAASSMLPSQGGDWMDANGLPVFNAMNYQSAKKWLALLKHLDEMGGVEFNQNQSYTLFSQGRVGITFSDARHRQELARLLGGENLAIDPWPEPMGSWVKSTAIYLNVNASLRSSAEHNSALMFMGALLSRSIQGRLASTGLLPVLRDVEIGDALDASAYRALASQTAAYPPAWSGTLRPVYLPVIDQLLQDVLIQGMPADQALPAAWQSIGEYFK
jgi:ABC-type glycerol-3-phosphate transport system substrate-binding protein